MRPFLIKTLQSVVRYLKAKDKRILPASVENRFKIAPHVSYEMAISEVTARRFDASGRKRVSWFEVFLLHARALDDFFGNVKKQPTDVVAGELLDNVDHWSVVRKRLPDEFLKRIRVPLNKRVVHLTWDRLQSTSKVADWDVLKDQIADVWRELECHWNTFLSEVEQVAPELRNRLESEYKREKERLSTAGESDSKRSGPSGTLGD